MEPINIKVKVDTSEIRKQLKKLQWQFFYTSIIVTICNWFRKDKIKVDVTAEKHVESTFMIKIVVDYNA